MPLKPAARAEHTERTHNTTQTNRPPTPNQLSGYNEHLQAVRDSGDWEEWLAFFLRGVLDVSTKAADTARRILALREKHRGMVTERLGYAAGNGNRVLEHLYERPIVSVADVQRLIGTTYATANNLVARMTDCGILQELTGQARNRVFRYRDYIALFHDDEELESPA